MSLELSYQSGGTFEMHPTGVVAARCVRVIELGTQESEYMGEKKRAKKLVITFETSALATEGEFAGKPFLISNRYTASMHEMAALRKALKSWRGRDFNEDELKKFDLKTILGKNCMINVVHNESGGKTYANIDSLMPLPSGMAAPKHAEPSYFDIDKSSFEDFEKLSNGMKLAIEKSPEWKSRTERSSKPAAPAAPAKQVEEFDDADIPF